MNVQTVESQVRASAVDRLVAAGIPCERDGDYIKIRVADAEKMLASIDEAERDLVELAALPRCEDAEGQVETHCQVKYVGRLAGRVADQLRTCGGAASGHEVLARGRSQRRGFRHWVESGGMPSRLREPGRD